MCSIVDAYVTDDADTRGIRKFYGIMRLCISRWKTSNIPFQSIPPTGIRSLTALFPNLQLKSPRLLAVLTVTQFKVKGVSCSLLTWSSNLVNPWTMVCCCCSVGGERIPRILFESCLDQANWPVKANDYLLEGNKYAMTLGSNGILAYSLVNVEGVGYELNGLLSLQRFTESVVGKLRFSIGISVPTGKDVHQSHMCYALSIVTSLQNPSMDFRVLLAFGTPSPGWKCLESLKQEKEDNQIENKNK
eukprot:scaffold108813_cov62-Attheya_sp.AAC.2